MSTPTIEIAEAGMFTTVQDRGRYGFQRFGVPVSGALDEFALRFANALAGNDGGAAGLEITVVGPAVRFLVDTWIAVTGADLSPKLDGEPLPQWQAAKVSEGGVLTFHDMRDGMRAYLAVAGGIDVPVVMGSRSTYVKARFGGYEGRPLRKGDVLSTLSPSPDGKLVPRGLPGGYSVPTYGESHEIRVILGPQSAAFGPEGIATLLESSYEISLDSDRMGYRLEGPVINHKNGPDIVSDGNPPGAVQVSGDGIPTILLADRGTTGGYTKIATVITVDQGRIAQAVPGQTVTFREVDVEEAHRLLREKEDLLAAIASSAPVPEGRSPGLSVVVDGEAYEVVDEEGRHLARAGAGGPPSAKRLRARATLGGQTYDFDVEIGQDGEFRA
jgi:biotin-dependent carboxylase-like uncharacterized protein